MAVINVKGIYPRVMDVLIREGYYSLPIEGPPEESPESTLDNVIAVASIFFIAIRAIPLGKRIMFQAEHAASNAFKMFGFRYFHL